jgi:hypothetical protein
VTEIRNPILNLGIRLVGRREQLRFARCCAERMERLINVRLVGGQAEPRASGATGILASPTSAQRQRLPFARCFPRVGLDVAVRTVRLPAWQAWRALFGRLSQAGRRLEDRNRQQLYGIAQRQNISGRSKMGRWDLIDAIRRSR